MKSLDSIISSFDPSGLSASNQRKKEQERRNAAAKAREEFSRLASFDPSKPFDPLDP